MNASETAAMLEAFRRVSGDARSIALLPFYRLAYTAFRYGYTTTALQGLRGSEAKRMARAASRYSRWILEAAACLAASATSPRTRIVRSPMKA